MRIWSYIQFDMFLSSPPKTCIALYNSQMLKYTQHKRLMFML